MQTDLFFMCSGLERGVSASIKSTLGRIHTSCCESLSFSISFQRIVHIKNCWQYALWIFWRNREQARDVAVQYLTAISSTVNLTNKIPFTSIVLGFVAEISQISENLNKSVQLDVTESKWENINKPFDTLYTCANATHDAQAHKDFFHHHHHGLIFWEKQL